MTKFEDWNYVDTERLAREKLGTVEVENIFNKTTTENFTSYYQILVPSARGLKLITSYLYLAASKFHYSPDINHSCI